MTSSLNTTRSTRKFLSSSPFLNKTLKAIVSGATFLGETKGEEFIEKLWIGMVEDANSVDPKLEIVA